MMPIKIIYNLGNKKMNQTVNSSKVQKLSSFAWSIAEILRGDFKQSDYAKVVLPFIILRRLDCILIDSKDKVVAANKNIPETATDKVRDMMLFNASSSNVKIYNTHPFTLEKIKDQEASDLQNNLRFITRLA